MKSRKIVSNVLLAIDCKCLLKAVKVHRKKIPEVPKLSIDVHQLGNIRAPRVKFRKSPKVFR